MPVLHVRLSIPGDEMLRYYRGTASSVNAVSEEGPRVQFPASALRPFVDARGIQGRFALHFNPQNRLQRIIRLA